MAEKDIHADNEQDLEESHLEDFLKELAEYHADYVLLPGEFTVSMIMQYAADDVDRGGVLVDLHDRVKRGELGEKEERIEGRRQYVFWRIKKTP